MGFCEFRLVFWRMLQCVMDDRRREKEQGWFVTIGASGGDGLRDIEALLGHLPVGLNAVVLIVLHRSADQISHLREILARSTKLPVIIADQGERLKAGTCYIGEPDQHLTLVAKSLGRLIDDPGHQYRNRTIDLLFRSVALHARESAIGIVLSGSLDDGSRGLEAIHRAGGLTMVLTPKPGSARGMPENAIGFDGPIDLIGSSSQIATAIIEAVATRPALVP
jgi:two-component system, chemotaxis family, protein-glutamate methylesterase/glutaminase